MIPLATECIAVGHLVAFVLGMQVGCQPADEVQPLLFLCGDADCGQAGGALERGIGQNVVGQRQRGSPGQGCATASSIGASTRA